MKKTLLTLLSVFIVSFTFAQVTNKISNKIEISRSIDGKIIKSIAGTTKASTNLNSFAAIEPKSVAGVTFSESWEGYPDDESSWIPGTWSRKKVGESIEEWGATGAIVTFGIYPTDGNFFEWINYDFDWDAFVAKDQDEWIISPAFSPKSNDSISFDLYYAAIFMYYKYDEATEEYIIDFSSPAFTTQLLIKESGQDSWTTLWDVDDLVSRYDEETIFDYLGDWESFKISLKQYEGKDVQIAFRYVGNNGDSVGLDNIVVGSDINSGIANTHGKLALTAVKSGDAFELTYPQGYSTVSVYAVNGQLKASYALPASGSFSVPATGLGKGVYLLKFSGNKTQTIKVLN